MHHVTKYCNVIVPHCTVRRDIACIRISPDPSLFAEVGLACETKYNAGASKSTSIMLLKTCDSSTQSIYLSKITKLQHKDSGFCHKTLSLLIGFRHETGRQQN